MNGEHGVIQSPQMKINVAQIYKHTPGAKYLLVINNETDKETIDKAKEFAANLGSHADVWDLSYYGMLDLEKLMLLSSNDNTLEDFTGKTIILLNNSFHTNQQKQAQSLDFLKKEQFLKAASQYGIHFTILQSNDVGPSGVFESFVIPTQTPEKISQMTYESFMKSIKVIDESFDKRAGGVFSDELNVNEIAFEVSSEKTKLFYPAYRRDLEWKASKISRKLQRRQPENQFIQIVNYEPKVLKTWLWGLIKKYRPGEITVRKTLESNEANSIEINLSEERNLFSSERGYFSLLVGTDFEEKLNIIDDFTHDILKSKTLENVQVREQFINALLYDLVSEQTTYRMEFWKTHSRSEIKTKLKKIRRLVTQTTLFSNTSTSIEGKFFAEFMGRFEAFIDSQTKWYHYFIPGSNDASISKVSKRFIKTWLKSNFKYAGQESVNEFMEHYRKSYVEETTKYKELSIKRSTKGKFVARELYLDEIKSHDPLRENMTVSQVQYSEIKASDRKRELNTESLTKGESEVLKELKVELDCNNKYLPIIK